jgi:hypothetical protein
VFPFSAAWGNLPQIRARSSSADGFICSVDGFSCSADPAKSRLDDKFWRERVLSRSGGGKFYSVAAKNPFGEGFQSPSKGNVYRSSARDCVNPPISRISGANKTVGGANQTMNRVNQNIGGANQTDIGANQTVVRANQTVDRVNQTIDGAEKTVDRLN